MNILAQQLTSDDEKEDDVPIEGPAEGPTLAEYWELIEDYQQQLDDDARGR